MNLSRTKPPRAVATTFAEPTEAMLLDAAAATLQAEIDNRADGMRAAAQALEDGHRRHDALQSKADAATARHRGLAAERLAKITATREAGDALVRAGNDEAGSAELMTAAQMEQGLDAAGAAVRAAELLAASLRGALAEQEALCAGLSTALDEARRGHEAACTAALVFANDRAAAAFVETTTALLAAPGVRNLGMHRFDFTFGYSPAYREIVGLKEARTFNPVFAQHPVQARRDAADAADRAAVQIEVRQRAAAPLPNLR